MLNQWRSSAMIPVRDVERAREFYHGTLGLPIEKEEKDEGILELKTGDTTLVTYQSEYAGTNQGNAVVWDVGDELESIVAELGKKGVAFEHYEMPDLERKGDIYVSDNFQCAWFKDPDGNILHLTRTGHA